MTPHCHQDKVQMLKALASLQLQNISDSYSRVFPRRLQHLFKPTINLLFFSCVYYCGGDCVFVFNSMFWD
jgi:hypothetical protein